MKTSNKTKNVRWRFFRVTRRKLNGLFGPVDKESENARALMVDTSAQDVIDRAADRAAYVPPPIYTAPMSQKQGVKGK